MTVTQLEEALKANAVSEPDDAQLKERCAQLERELVAEKEKVRDWLTR